MSDQSPSGSPDPSYLVSVFEHCRKGAGLSAKRLTEDNRAAPLLALPAVTSRAPSEDALGATAFQIITESVQRLPDLTDRLVVDVVLGLGIHSEALAKPEVTDQILRNLRSSAVGTRRTALREHWHRLHSALGATAQPQPSDRYLRGTLETEAFAKLASLLVSPAARAVPAAVPAPRRESMAAPPPGRKVVVVGGVAIDHIWRVEQIPEVETSTLAENYVQAPGGKGLTQAVAAARMGLDVSLVAAITDDRDAGRIVDHLTTAGVDTSLLREIPGRRTGQTGILERPRGESNAATWPSTAQLDLAHMEKHADAIAACDVLMVTFEIPKPVLYRTLDIASFAGDRSPTVIVTSGQPYPDGVVSIDHLSQIDYLVAHLWELSKFPRSPDARYDLELLSQDLLDQGVKALCILDNHGGAIYQRGSVRQISTPTVNLKESSITRDVFCAALALKVSDRQAVTNAVIDWISTAMTCFAEDYRSQSTPPTPTWERVEREIALRGNR